MSTGNLRYRDGPTALRCHGGFGMKELTWTDIDCLGPAPTVVRDSWRIEVPDARGLPFDEWEVDLKTPVLSLGVPGPAPQAFMDAIRRWWGSPTLLPCDRLVVDDDASGPIPAWGTRSRDKVSSNPVIDPAAVKPLWKVLQRAIRRRGTDWNEVGLHPSLRQAGFAWSRVAHHLGATWHLGWVMTVDGFREHLESAFPGGRLLVACPLAVAAKLVEEEECPGGVVGVDGAQFELVDTEIHPYLATPTAIIEARRR